MKETELTMMLARGRNAGGNKSWGRKVTCVYRDCSTNTKDSDKKKMFPFPKPCSTYVHSLIDPVKFEHSVNECDRCAKSFRWIQLCGNTTITNLEDVHSRTYVCVKHFHGDVGPTDSCPDPLPARYSSTSSKPSKGRGQRRVRAPSPLVEAIPFVEAVYDADAVSQRIQQAIELEAQCHGDRANQPLFLFGQSDGADFIHPPLNHALNHTGDEPNPETFRGGEPNLEMNRDGGGPSADVRALLKAERKESARLARKLARCQATAKRRLQTIRELKSRLKAAEGGTKGGGARQRKT